MWGSARKGNKNTQTNTKTRFCLNHKPYGTLLYDSDSNEICKNHKNCNTWKKSQKWIRFSVTAVFICVFSKIVSVEKEIGRRRIGTGLSVFRQVDYLWSN
jgi:hypothetical protein